MEMSSGRGSNFDHSIHLYSCSLWYGRLQSCSECWCVRAHTRTHMLMVNTECLKSQSWGTLFLRQGCSRNLELTDWLASCPGQEAPDTSLCLLQHWDYECTWPCLAILHCFWGIKTRSSCLHSNTADCHLPSLCFFLHFLVGGSFTLFW